MGGLARAKRDGANCVKLEHRAAKIPIAPDRLSPFSEFRLGVHSSIFKVQGDGRLQFVQVVQTLDAAMLQQLV